MTNTVPRYCSTVLNKKRFHLMKFTFRKKRQIIRNNQNKLKVRFLQKQKRRV